MRIAQDGIAWQITSGGQQWQIAWYPPPDPPVGTPHGSAAVCSTNGGIVLISGDGQLWGFPGGRPEQGEDWLDVLHRELWEEACITVTGQRLLGYSHGQCLQGHQAGLVLVRAWWAATVDLQPWQPQHEITHRKLVAPQDVYDSIWIEDGYAPMYLRILSEAGISASEQRRVSEYDQCM
jgi:8-oxo-dGTP pyrophosphatase MutT (NUDIX family)